MNIYPVKNISERFPKFKNIFNNSSDIKTKYIVLITILIGLAAQFLSYHFDYVYAYRDAIFRTEAARRFLDATNPGFINQLGTVWLPIPNIILMPFTSIDFMWYSGLCGSIVNFFAFLVSSVVIYLMLKLYTKNSLSSFFGFLVFILNYNILYFQTTAMTEVMYLCFIILLIYFSSKWVFENKYRFIFYASIFSALALGTRYDAWPIFGVSSILLLVTSVKLKRKLIKSIFLYTFLPALFLCLWLLYNWIYLGDVLEFSRGKFSTLAQLKYYEDAGRLLTKHNFLLSLNVTLSSISAYSGILIAFLGLSGAGYYFYENKKDISKYFPFIFLFAFPASLILLYLGQLIIELPNSEPPGYFNSRYGLYIFPGISFFAGILVYNLRQIKNELIKIILTSVVLILFILQSLFSFSWFPSHIPALAEAKYSFSQPSVDVSEFLNKNYDGEKLLYDGAIFAIYPWAKVNLRDRITFHTFDLGEKAMKNPVPYAKWVMFYTKAPNDFIFNALDTNSNFRNNYDLVFSESGIEVYKRK
ncbi:MAG TPA: hypothetical protein VIK14_08595 [Ignavibacteria bacterium]